MTQWSKNKVLPSQINNGNEYTANDDLSVEAVNAIVNNSFYAADNSASAIGIIDLESQSGTLSETDYDNAVNNGYFLRYGNTLFINSSSNEFYVWFYNTMVSNSTISSEYNRQNQKYIKVTKSNRYYTYTTSDFVEFYTKAQSDSGFIKKYSTMPTASQDYLGDIAHYIGTTNSTYTNGYFYECVENNGVYSWVQKDVQPAPPAITVDSDLSTSSENPVQNKVITNDLNTRALDTSVVHKTGDESVFGLKAFDTRPKVGIEGTLPTGYERIEYVQSTNGQYINTAYTSHSIGKAKMQISFDNITDDQWLLGYQMNVGGALSHDGYDIFVALESGEIKYKITTVEAYIAGNPIRTISSGLTPTIGTVYDIETEIIDYNQYIKIDGVTLGTSTYKLDTQGVDATLFKANGVGTKLGQIKLYSCKLYDTNGNLIRDYVPCKRATDNEIGLYDFVQGVFFPSLTTSFVGGSAVTPTDNNYVMLKGDIDKITTLDETETQAKGLIVKGERLKFVELPEVGVNDKDKYLHTNATTGAYELVSLQVPNVVQDLTSNTAGTLDSTAWGTLKSTHTATIASPTMTGLDSSYEFVNIKLSINSINQYVKLAKNTTNKYSGLFFIEESTNLYEITTYYNGTSIILRCATVK